MSHDLPPLRATLAGPAADGPRPLAGALAVLGAIGALGLLLGGCNQGAEPSVPVVAAPATASDAQQIPTLFWAAAPTPPPTDKTQRGADEGEPWGDDASAKRGRAGVERELADLERLVASTPTASPELPAILLRQAQSHSELAVLALASRDAQAAAASRQRAIAEYQALRSSHPSFAKADEVLLALGSELLADRQLGPGRQALLEVIETYPSSPMVPRAYVTFGDLFFDEAAGDPSKMALARQAYDAALRYPPPANPLYGYASYRLAWVALSTGDAQGALASFKRCIEHAAQHGSASPSAARIGEQARKDIVIAYVPVGRPEAAYPFFRQLSGDGDAEHGRTTELMAGLARAYVEGGHAPEAVSVCDALLAHHVDRASCRACQELAHTLATSSALDPPAAALFASRVKRDCGPVR